MNNKKAIKILEAMKNDAVFSQRFALDKAIESLSSDWVSVDRAEEIEIHGEEILVFDGCDFHIDFVDDDVESGISYMSNQTQPTHWMPLTPPKEINNEST